MTAQATASHPAALSALADLEAKAGEAVQLLRLLSNEKRLLILCRLVAQREVSVGELGAAVGLSQSALSQHLARMRQEGLVATRRQAQTIFYRVADSNARRVLKLLKNIYCP